MGDIIRQMRESELSIVMKWAEEEGWNPGKNDYKAYYAYDDKGFLILERDQNPIAAIAVVRHASILSFIGLFIVKKEYRYQGVGKKIWQAAMLTLKENKCLGLYAVPRQIPWYQKQGFFKAYTNHRWQLTKTGGCEPLADDIPFQSKDYSQLIEFDSTIWGTSRKKLFDELFKELDTRAYISFDQESNRVNGYGLIRSLKDGFRIGPMYCDTIQSAKSLVPFLLSKIPAGEKVIFDMPAKNHFSQIFALYFGLIHVESFDTEAMFNTEELVNLGEEKCYGLASLEIG